MLYTVFTICVIIDESNKLNKNISVISLELVLSFLFCRSSVMETNPFTFQVAYTIIESKIKIHGILSDPLSPMCVRQLCQSSKLLHNIVAEVLANFINDDNRIKEMQIRGHEIKIVNFTDNTTIFLRDITCLNSIQVILRLYEKDKLVQRQFFQKAKPLWGGAGI